MAELEHTWVNGLSQDGISVYDRGLQFGDGLFETMPIIDGRIPFLDRHRQRLHEGCTRLRLTPPDASLDRELRRAAAGIERAILKLVYTRGSSARGYSPPKTASPNRILYRSAWPPGLLRHDPTGLHVRWCRHRLPAQPALAGIKHLNRLDQILARAEWDEADIQEGLMLNREGEVIEGVSSNLFLVRNEQLITPDLTNCGVSGIMQGRVLEIAQEAGMAVHTGSVTQQDVLAAEEVFMTNSLMGLRPVSRLEKREYSVGPVTLKLLSGLNASAG